MFSNKGAIMNIIEQYCYIIAAIFVCYMGLTLMDNAAAELQSIADPHEDIPFFNESIQKRLDEAEKKKTHPIVFVQNPGGPERSVGNMKVELKNYTSLNSGVKIVAANREADSVLNVLVSSRDELMLNLQFKYTSRVWHIVELCEAIQVKNIELANFVSYSSSPKDFTVYVSDRYPTRDWSLIGQFTARDKKVIQSFDLLPHLFAKFIRIELQSHGYEHFCPISSFPVYGTCEFEVLETETENHVQESISKNHEDEDVNNNDEDFFESKSDGLIMIDVVIILIVIKVHSYLPYHNERFCPICLKRKLLYLHKMN